MGWFAGSVEETAGGGARRGGEDAHALVVAQGVGAELGKWASWDGRSGLGLVAIVAVEI